MQSVLTPTPVTSLASNHSPSVPSSPANHSPYSSFHIKIHPASDPLHLLGPMPEMLSPREEYGLICQFIQFSAQHYFREVNYPI